jgi:integrase
VSISKRGGKYEVRWWEGGRHVGRTFERQKDAEAFELDVKRRKQLGPLAPGVLQSRMTLAEFVAEEWWPRYAIPNLKDSTRRRYLEVWGTYLLPRVGGYELRAITPMLVEDLRDQLRRMGLGAASQRKALLLLSGILRRAAVRGLIPNNPVTDVDLPKAPPTGRPHPLSPRTVELIRVQLRTRDQTLVSLLAYGGLRPGEAYGARWGDLSERTLYIPARKTAAERYLKLVAPLAQDLAEWRMACGRPGDRELIFAPTTARNSGGESVWANWVKRVYIPAAREAGVTGDMRAYRLRGSFVSLMLWEGQSLTRVAEWAGHSVATLARHYAGVLEELEDQPRVPAAEAIRQARTEILCTRHVREAEGA